MLLRAWILPFLLSALAGQACAQGVLIDKSDIRFVSKQMGVNFEGRFRKWKANVVFLPNDLARSKAESVGAACAIRRLIQPPATSPAKRR